MRRNLFLPAFIALSAIGLVGGCAEPEASILINAHVFLTGASVEEATEEGMCPVIDYSECSAVSFDDETKFATRLFADVARTAPQVAIVMANQLVNTETLAQLGEDNNLRVDTNSIQLEAVVATFSPSGPLKNIGDGGRVEVPHAGLLRAEGNLHLTSSLALFNDAEALASTVKTVAGENGGFVVTSVDLQIIGKTLAGNEVASNIVTMPIQLCYGCTNANICEEAATPLCAP